MKDVRKTRREHLTLLDPEDARNRIMCLNTQMMALERRFGYKADPLAAGQDTQENQDFLKIG